MRNAFEIRGRQLAESITALKQPCSGGASNSQVSSSNPVQSYSTLLFFNRFPVPILHDMALNPRLLSLKFHLLSPRLYRGDQMNGADQHSNDRAKDTDKCQHHRRSQ